MVLLAGNGDQIMLKSSKPFSLKSQVFKIHAEILQWHIVREMELGQNLMFVLMKSTQKCETTRF